MERELGTGELVVVADHHNQICLDPTFDQLSYEFFAFFGLAIGLFQLQEGDLTFSGVVCMAMRI